MVTKKDRLYDAIALKANARFHTSLFYKHALTNDTVYMLWMDSYYKEKAKLRPLLKNVQKDCIVNNVEVFIFIKEDDYFADEIYRAKITEVIEKGRKAVFEDASKKLPDYYIEELKEDGNIIFELEKFERLDFEDLKACAFLVNGEKGFDYERYLYKGRGMVSLIAP